MTTIDKASYGPQIENPEIIKNLRAWLDGYIAGAHVSGAEINGIRNALKAYEDILRGDNAIKAVIRG